MSTDAHLLHSEWARRLGAPFFISLIVALSLPLSIFVLLPHSLAALAGPSCALAMIGAGVVAMLAVPHHSHLSRRFPSSVLFHSSSLLLGERPAVGLAWVDLLDAVMLSGVIARAWSEHLDLLLRGNVSEHLTVEGGVGGANFDLAVLLAVLLSAAVLCGSLRIASTISLLLIVVCCMVVTSCTLVSFFHADPRNWRGEMFSGGGEGLCRALALLLLCLAGIDSVCHLFEETTHPRRKAKILPAAALFIYAVMFVITLIFSLSVEVSALPRDLKMPEFFAIQRIPAAKYMITVSSVCGLSAATLVSFIPGSRIVALLSINRLIPVTPDKSTKSPYKALFIFCLLVCLTVFFDKETMLNVLSFTTPLKLLAMVVLSLLSQFTADAVGRTTDAADYRQIDKRRRLSFSSYLDIDGKVVSGFRNGDGEESDDSDDSLDSTSRLQMRIARREYGKQQRHFDKVDLHASLTRSVSHYQEIGDHSSVSSFAKHNKGHNCVLEACSDGEDDTCSDRRVHLFGRDQEMSVGVFDGDEDEGQSCPNWRRALYTVLCLILIGVLAGCVLRHTELGGIPCRILLSLLVFSLFPLLLSVKMLRPREGSRPLPCFPFLSLLPIAIISPLLSLIDWRTGGIVTVWMMIGLAIYVFYGRFHSVAASRTSDFGDNQAREQRREERRGILQ